MKTRLISKIALFAGLYIVFAKAGLLLALDGGFACPVWLGSGTALSLLLFNGNKIWPAITIGSFIVNWINGGSLAFASVVCVGNTLEALISFNLICYFKSQTFLFIKLKSVLIFLFASATGAIISALFGGLAYWLFHSKEINLIEIMGTWWIGNFTSFLLIVPIVFLFDKSILLLFKNYNSFISIPLLILTCYFTFLVDYDSKVLPEILLYVLFVFPIFASLTQNRISSLIHVLIIELFAILTTYNGNGPFIFLEMNSNLIILQSFMAIITIVTLIIAVGIKEKQLIEDKLTVLLSEKEMLISEIHHRVKNNLAIVSSLLYLQNETIEEIEIRNKINQTDLRIKTIALVHEKLYEKSNVNTVEFSNYIESLTKMIFRVYESNIKLILNLEKINLPIETAQPLGLIINELLTNSFKHAFSKEEGSEIEIKLETKENKYFLLFRDNGKGIENQNNNFDSLGLTLIDALADQIDAHYTVNNLNGATYEFYFK